ncbi:unnamed protein product [Zymoseptoria tritici ST99CH_1E4]|uniref:Uncharacterized protein n=1 Tax=Zymoseptoria tritici ST99CH_1E4 TaxID=1276532 RepID=A0A2H1H9D0_ZYMTR|nr:unnamed protein product [Zymoseptoria tritici ST99CH_1E4]
MAKSSSYVKLHSMPSLHLTHLTRHPVAAQPNPTPIPIPKTAAAAAVRVRSAPKIPPPGPSAVWCPSMLGGGKSESNRNPSSWLTTLQAREHKSEIARVLQKRDGDGQCEVEWKVTSEPLVAFFNGAG